MTILICLAVIFLSPLPIVAVTKHLDGYASFMDSYLFGCMFTGLFQGGALLVLLGELIRP